MGHFKISVALIVALLCSYSLAAYTKSPVQTPSATTPTASEVELTIAPSEPNTSASLYSPNPRSSTTSRDRDTNRSPQSRVHDILNLSAPSAEKVESK